MYIIVYRKFEFNRLSLLTDSSLEWYLPGHLLIACLGHLIQVIVVEVFVIPVLLEVILILVVVMGTIFVLDIFYDGV